MQGLVDGLNEGCVRYGLKVNIGKTDVLGVIKRSNQLTVNISLGGNVLQQVRLFNYLEILSDFVGKLIFYDFFWFVHVLYYLFNLDSSKYFFHIKIKFVIMLGCLFSLSGERSKREAQNIPVSLQIFFLWDSANDDFLIFVFAPKLTAFSFSLIYSIYL